MKKVMPRLDNTSISYFIENKSENETCVEWWCNQKEALLTFEVIVIFLCIVGSFGNLVTVLAIQFSSLRNNVNSILIGSLSVGGFLYCVLILPLQAVIYHMQTPTIKPEFCQAAGGIRYTLVGVIMANLGVIALYRYLNVVHLTIYHKLSNRRPLMTTILLAWTVPLLFTLGPSLGVWGSYCFQPAVLACTFDNHPGVDQSNRITTVTAGFIVPCMFIVFCYARIGCVAYGSSKRVNQWRSNASQTKALRLSAMMLCIFAIFFLGTFPYFIVNVYDRQFAQPVHHIWTTGLGWLSYCLNPVVYTVMDNNFRTAYRRFLVGDCEKSPLRRANTGNSTHYPPTSV